MSVLARLSVAALLLASGCANSSDADRDAAIPPVDDGSVDSSDAGVSDDASAEPQGSDHCYDDPSDPIPEAQTGASDPSVDGSEPECQAAYMRAAECYLQQTACAAGSAEYAPVFARTLAQVWCATNAGKAGGLEALAMKQNASTPCSSYLNRELCMTFDVTPVTHSACHDETLSGWQCENACKNALRCQLVDGTQEECEASCSDRTPELRCAHVDERTSCDVIATCFNR